MEVLRVELEKALDAAKRRGVSPEEAFRVLTEVYECARGDMNLADHYGGADQIPPRLVVPPLVRRV